MKKAEYVSLLESVRDNKVTMEDALNSLNKKRSGRNPNVSYEIWQHAINDVAPNMNPKRWTAYSFSRAAWNKLNGVGVQKLQQPVQIANLIKKNVLALPPKPEVPSVV